MTLGRKQRRFGVKGNVFPAALIPVSAFCTPGSALHTMHSGVAKGSFRCRFDSIPPQFSTDQSEPHPIPCSSRQAVNRVPRSECWLLNLRSYLEVPLLASSHTFFEIRLLSFPLFCCCMNNHSFTKIHFPNRPDAVQGIPHSI